MTAGSERLLSGSFLASKNENGKANNAYLIPVEAKERLLSLATTRLGLIHTITKV